MLRVELAPVEFDFGQLYLLLLEVAWIAEVKVQPILFMAILCWGYVFQFMYFDLVKMDIMYFDSGFWWCNQTYVFTAAMNKVLKF